MIDNAFRICKLDEQHLPLLKNFDCVETKECLECYKSKDKQKIRTLSRDLENFLKYEAYNDQKMGFSTTHLLLFKDNNGVEKIGAYVSLCNDNICLQNDEKNELGYPYDFIPSVKIARLAVSNDMKNKGIGKYMIKFVAYKGLEIRENSGLVFINLDCYKHRKLYYENIGFVPSLAQRYENQGHLPISMRIVLDDFLETLS